MAAEYEEYADVQEDEQYENDFHLVDRWLPSRFLLLEFLGTYFYTLISAGVVISCGVFTYQFTSDEMNAARHLCISVANAFAYGAMLYVAQSFMDNAAKREHERKGGIQPQFSTFTVGHFNPAITFAVALVNASSGDGGDATPQQLKQRKKTGSVKSLSPMAAVLYVFAQSIASCLAGVTIWFAFPFARHSTMGASVPSFGMGATKYQALFAEALLTFFLVLSALTVGLHGERSARDIDDQFTPTIKERGGSPQVGGGWVKYSAPLSMTFTLLACTIVGSPVSGISLNPARSLGPALVGNYWIDHWVYWAGPMGGAFAAALIYQVATWGQ